MRLIAHSGGLTAGCGERTDDDKSKLSLETTVRDPTTEGLSTSGTGVRTVDTRVWVWGTRVHSGTNEKIKWHEAVRIQLDTSMPARLPLAVPECAT